MPDRPTQRRTDERDDGRDAVGVVSHRRNRGQQAHDAEAQPLSGGQIGQLSVR